METVVERGSRDIPVYNETEASSSRITQDGRKITYKLLVLQQPARARACGSGAKSSADRRPVDPPPIVELKIFEGENAETDVTASLAANYFLFATLEQARQIAQPRGSAPEERPRPVLTGTAVSGMTYLDRPNPAGYFIFADLSVRNEGKYRLSFSLYEELKNAKDTDRGNDADAGNPTDHVTHRVEVKSTPFHVYSAKRFPGLESSTILSRAMADQGCKVRIRRDVRMRARRGDNKTKQNDWDDYSEDYAARGRMSATPEASQYNGFVDSTGRARSASNASHHSINNPTLSRRTSMNDMSAYPQTPYPPMVPQHEQPQASPYGPPATQSFATSSFAPQPPSMSPMQPPPTFQHASSAPVSTGPPADYYGFPTAMPQPPQHQQQMSQPPQNQQQMPQPPQYEQQANNSRMSVDHTHQAPLEEPRRPSLTYNGPIPSQHAFSGAHTVQTTPVLANPPMQNYAFQSMLPPSRTPLTLPPLTYPDQPKFSGPTSPAVSTTSSGYNAALLATTDVPVKRSFGNVFNDRYISQPLRDGARPSYPHSGSGSGSSIASVSGSLNIMATDDDPDQGENCEPSMVVRYKRADGSSVMRALPPHC